MSAAFHTVCAAGAWLWQRRGQAVLGLLAFSIGIGGSALQPGHWWAH